MSPSPARRGGVLAIDHGARTSGFAVTDALRIATTLLPPARLPGDGPALVEHVRGLAAERDLAVILVGLPLSENGNDTERSRAARAFGARLAAALPHLRVLGWDERLTTRAAQELLLEQGLPKKRREELRDSAAALVLLRDWIASGEPATHPLG